jgi:hypothetical protein
MADAGPVAHITTDPEPGRTVSSWTDTVTGWFATRPFLLFVVLYLGVAAVGPLALWVLPEPFHLAIAALTNGTGLGAFDPNTFGRSGPRPPMPEADLWAIAAVAMGAAGVLALPVAWLYTITRQKRGYRQSVVHSLILLPVVVAGVVVLVKFSLALAFSLAGIVAAVRFRNTLEDSKDAVYIFVATAVGLSCGVELSVALSLSFVFNLVTLLLFKTDFGRSPARLEGEMAEQRMRRALAMANRTSQFVARIDREILEQMAPEQLEAIADRAWQRRRAVDDRPSGEVETRADAQCAVWTDGSMQAREAVERVLLQLTKRWKFVSAESPETGGQRLVYDVRLKKSIQPTWFMDAVRREGGAGITEVTLA